MRDRVGDRGRSRFRVRDRLRVRARGQSEIIGFVLVFGMVMLTLGLVAATGYAGLEDARDFERANNAERGMGILAANVDDVAEGAPSRATELKLDGAKLAVADPVSVTVSGERVGDPTESFSYSTSVRPLVYDPGIGTGTRVHYTSGAVLREEPHGAVMVRPPELVLTNEAAVVPLVRTTVPGNRSLGGTTTALVEANRGEERVVRSTTTAYELTLSVTTPRADAWYRYLAAHSATTCSRSGDTVTCTLTADRIAVSVTDVRVRFS